MVDLVIIQKVFGMILMVFGTIVALFSVNLPATITSGITIFAVGLAVTSFAIQKK